MRVARVGVNMSIFFNISVDVLFYILRRHTNIYNDHNTIRLLLMYVIPSTIFLREICSSKQPNFGYLLHLT